MPSWIFASAMAFRVCASAVRRSSCAVAAADSDDRRASSAARFLTDTPDTDIASRAAYSLPVSSVSLFARRSDSARSFAKSACCCCVPPPRMDFSNVAVSSSSARISLAVLSNSADNALYSAIAACCACALASVAPSSFASVVSLPVSMPAASMDCASASIFSTPDTPALISKPA